MELEQIYVFMLALLMILAVFDLMVGVSNDAVNFLNSAFGSKVASFKSIMIVASIGIAIGAIFSNGMMEIAKFGIVNPDKFYFEEIMIIFTSVILADILLIDFFNTLGMPTSTTVSVVFELLGAPIGLTLSKILFSNSTQKWTDVTSYINTSKAYEVIVAIFVSVAFAFVFGLVIQYISRLVFTFNYEKKLKYFIGIFGGFALSSLAYFLIIKGLNGVSFMPKNFLNWIKNNSLTILAVFFVLFTILSQILHKLNVNVFKVIILSGTFSLGMAFAGNDLINFIGVSVAGWEAFNIWNDAGQPANMTMEGLRNNNPGSTLFLMTAGIIMVLTLWFSKKARNVMQTEIGLSNQEETRTEKFNANYVSRLVVRGAIGMSNIVDKIMPRKLSNSIEARFYKPTAKKNQPDQPAFDLVRASVNLIVSSSLISLGTSMKLPLSTTYVAFMVAMSSSLADRAWGRDTAVFRVAGVFNVIGSWFVTAIAAFFMAFTISALIYLGGIYALLALSFFVLFIFFRSHVMHNKKVKSEEEKRPFEKEELVSINEVVKMSSQGIAVALEKMDLLYKKTIDGLSNEDRISLKETKKLAKKLNEDIADLKVDTYFFIKTLDDSSLAATKFYILILDYLRNMAQPVFFMAENSYEYVNNNHRKLKKSQLQDLRSISNELSSEFQKILQIIEISVFSNSMTKLIEDQNRIKADISALVDKQIKDIRYSSESGLKNTNLYFSLLLESKTLVNSTINMLSLIKNFKDQYKHIQENK